jgi:hypothetical protein
VKKIFVVGVVCTVLLGGCSNQDPSEYKKSTLMPPIKLPEIVQKQAELEQFKVPSKDDLGGSVDVSIEPPTLKK